MAIAETEAAERWSWTPEELKAMPMEELLFNLARVALRMAELTDRDGALVLRGSSAQS